MKKETFTILLDEYVYKHGITFSEALDNHFGENKYVYSITDEPKLNVMIIKVTVLNGDNNLKSFLAYGTTNSELLNNLFSRLLPGCVVKSDYEYGYCL